MQDPEMHDIHSSPNSSVKQNVKVIEDMVQNANVTLREYKKEIELLRQEI